MQNGWTADHVSFINNRVGYEDNRTIKLNYITVYWGDGNNDQVDIKFISRDNDSNDTISEIGDNSSSGWTRGVTHQYPDNATTEYVVGWGSYARESSINMGGSQYWSNKTKVNIRGAYTGNTSPVGAAPSVVGVQKNKDFIYQMVATDANSDNTELPLGDKRRIFRQLFLQDTEYRLLYWHLC